MKLESEMMFWGNIATAVAYFTITSQLLVFVHSPKVLKMFDVSNARKDRNIKRVFHLMLAVSILFASFIFMCGNTHLVNIFRHIYPENKALKSAQAAIMLSCAFISVLTAIVGFRLFPAIAETFPSFEIGDDGRIQHSENYLVEVVELIKESILILSDDLVVMRGNEVSKLLFGAPVVGTSICTYIKPTDIPLFQDTVMRVMGSYNFTPATIEVRIRREACSEEGSPYRSFRSRSHSQHSSHTRSRGNAAHVHCARCTPTPSPTHGISKLAPPTPLSSSDDDDFIWIEVTMCKGKYNTDDGGFEYDLKMVCRDIDDRKKRALYQSMVEGTEERGRINESKLRYISCIAHDLKTPLQSFSFTLDLLNHTGLHPEQKEYIQQANVAVDLMRLTISQTMDISKALTGAKLTPRRTTVFISSVLNRVKIIILGYGKEVPVSFEVAPDVCDEIITDEEWLWQMLLNLLTNACKYTDKGSITVRLSVTQDNLMCNSVSTEKLHSLPQLQMPVTQANMLLCEVLDTGIGIRPDKIETLFDAFSQVQEGQVTGTGLGLFGVRTRAEGLLGSCGARHNTESSTGTGTVLWFAIPYTPDSDSAGSAHSTARVITGGNVDVPDGPLACTNSTRTRAVSFLPALVPLYGAHCVNTVRGSNNTYNDALAPGAIPVAASTAGSSTANDAIVNSDDVIRNLHLSAMVVEDTASVRKLMERLLLKMGFETVTAYENGAKGLDALLSQPPVDIVFSDVQMPIMTGPEMVARFRKFEADQVLINNNIPLITDFAATPTTTTTTVSTILNPTTTLNTTGTTSTTSINQTPQQTTTGPSPANPAAPRKRQLIVAVTANGTECGECGVDSFDEICPKPLTKTEIYRIINRYFQ